MCVVCRDRSAKRTLTRLVRTAEGRVLVDPSGKMNGRGAYLCDDKSCWDRALAGDVIAKALKTSLDDATKHELRAFAERNFTALADSPRASQEGNA